MVITEHICYRCGAVFYRKLHLQRHLNKKNQCEMINLDDDGEVLKVNTDDIILNDDNIKFDPLPEFDFNKVMDENPCCAVLLTAIRRSGKTTLIEKVFIPHVLKNYDIIFFIANTIDNDDVYHFLDGTSVIRFRSYSEQMFKDIFTFQRKTKRRFKIAVLMDDIVSRNKKHSDALLKFFIMGRNMNIAVLPLSTQSTTLVDKNNRNNCDVIYIGNNEGEFQEVVINAFLKHKVNIPKHIKTKGQREDYLYAYLRHHTSDHGFIVINNIDHKIYGTRLKL